MKHGSQLQITAYQSYYDPKFTTTGKLQYTLAHALTWHWQQTLLATNKLFYFLTPSQLDSDWNGTRLYNLQFVLWRSLQKFHQISIFAYLKVVFATTYSNKLLTGLDLRLTASVWEISANTYVLYTGIRNTHTNTVNTPTQRPQQSRYPGSTSCIYLPLLTCANINVTSVRISFHLMWSLASAYLSLVQSFKCTLSSIKRPLILRRVKMPYEIR